MPLPKGIKAALDAWKASTGEFPAELDDGVFFPNDGAFMAEVGKKAKGREAQAREAATAEFLSRLGLTDPAEIEAVKETLDKTGVLKTEADKTKGELAKAIKAIEDSRKETEMIKAANVELLGKIKGTTRRSALSAFAAQVVDHEALTMFVEPLLDVSDDGTVTVKSDPKKTIAELVAETLKAKPYLKNPTFKEGTGTKPTPTTETTAKLPFTPNDKGELKNVGQQIVNELYAKGQLQAPSGGLSQPT
jgi:hypothetical protein